MKKFSFIIALCIVLNGVLIECGLEMKTLTFPTDTENEIGGKETDDNVEDKENGGKENGGKEEGGKEAGEVVVPVMSRSSGEGPLDIPDLPNSVLPEIPTVPDIPVLPQIPVPPVPEVPGIPELPQIQEPQIPVVPDIPGLPQIPEVPRFQEPPMGRTSGDSPPGGIGTTGADDYNSGKESGTVPPQVPQPGPPAVPDAKACV